MIKTDFEMVQIKSDLSKTKMIYLICYYIFYILLEFKQFRFVPVVHVKTSQIQDWNINTIQKLNELEKTWGIEIVKVLSVG